jgi:hypothetical protein
MAAPTPISSARQECMYSGRLRGASRSGRTASGKQLHINVACGYAKSGGVVRHVQIGSQRTAFLDSHAFAGRWRRVRSPFAVDNWESGTHSHRSPCQQPWNSIRSRSSSQFTVPCYHFGPPPHTNARRAGNSFWWQRPRSQRHRTLCGYLARIFQLPCQ